MGVATLFSLLLVAKMGGRKARRPYIFGFRGCKCCTAGGGVGVRSCTHPTNQFQPSPRKAWCHSLPWFSAFVTPEMSSCSHRSNVETCRMQESGCLAVDVANWGKPFCEPRSWELELDGVLRPEPWLRNAGRRSPKQAPIEIGRTWAWAGPVAVSSAFPVTRGREACMGQMTALAFHLPIRARAPAARNGHVAWCIKQKQNGWCHVSTDSPSRPQVRCHGSAHPHGCHMCDGLVPVSRGQGAQGRRAPRPGSWAERGRRHAGERPGGASVDPTACWVESSLAGRRDRGEVEEDKPESILGSPRDSGRPLGRSDQLPGDLPPWGGAEVSALLTGSNGEWVAVSAMARRGIRVPPRHTRTKLDMFRTRDGNGESVRWPRQIRVAHPHAEKCAPRRPPPRALEAETGMGQRCLAGDGRFRPRRSRSSASRENVFRDPI